MRSYGNLYVVVLYNGVLPSLPRVYGERGSESLSIKQAGVSLGTVTLTVPASCPWALCALLFAMLDDGFCDVECFNNIAPHIHID